MAWLSKLCHPERSELASAVEGPSGRRQPNAPCKFNVVLASRGACGGPKVLRLRSQARSAQDDREFVTHPPNENALKSQRHAGHALAHPRPPAVHAERFHRAALDQRVHVHARRRDLL